METLIFLAIAAVIAIVENKVKKSREQNQLPPSRPSDYDNEYAEDSEEEAQEPQVQPPRSLQDLIQQFENAQREAAQGNIEPPTPPVDRHHDPSKPVTFRDIAEAVIEMDVVDAEFLMEEFNLSEGDAISALNDLQKYRIIGRDMEDGEHDVLVHDMDELDILLSHERRATPQQNAEEPTGLQEPAADVEAEQARLQELERQRKLNSLEGRAKSARESAAAFSATETSSDTEDGTAPKPRRAPLVSTRSLADVRKGFIWAKVLDEPRFKRRWSTQYR
ncbi:MAG: hypothetical protein J6P30_06030 [Fibrobacter sp.]|nr:hypothetical protein [Fibrobacter sp.]